MILGGRVLTCDHSTTVTSNHRVKTLHLMHGEKVGSQAHDVSAIAFTFIRTRRFILKHTVPVRTRLKDSMLCAKCQNHCVQNLVLSFPEYFPSAVMDIKFGMYMLVYFKQGYRCSMMTFLFTSLSVQHLFRQCLFLLSPEQSSNISLDPPTHD